MIVGQKVHVQIVHYKGHHGSNMKPSIFFWFLGEKIREHI